MESTCIFQCIQNGTVVLTADQALEIYKVKLALQKQNRGVKVRGQSVQIATMYRVSPKTVRDIWNHTTWKPVTHQLWKDDGVCIGEQDAHPNSTASRNSTHHHDCQVPVFMTPNCDFLLCMI
jgi:hypothetical protein